MNKTDKIYIAGHTGLVGSAITRNLLAQGYTNLVYRTIEEFDLTRQDAVEKFFESEKPDIVFLAAAKVGGIYANNTYPAEFIYINLQIQNNIIHNAYRVGVKKLCFLGSSCIYPRLAPQPLKESYLLDGKLEETNEPYAIAKIAGIKMCQSYNRQYGTRYISVMPTNLYGINDNFNLQTSHVLPALIRKFIEAKHANAPSVTIWGTGTPRREFLFVDDMADACIYLMNHYDGNEFVNIGIGEDVTILELATIIKEEVNFTGTLEFDTTKPDGTPQKLLDVSQLHQLGWKAKISLREGIRKTLTWYLENKV
ncbi:MAG TPA: GDP-L-fucose synthase [Bacteroidota bacterium]|nr:GDP-L-fucose synthase [Bacteroidota bacterium]